MSVAEPQAADDLVVEGDPAPAAEPAVLVAEPAPEPVVVAAEPEPVAGEPEPAKPAKKTMLQELIDERTARKEERDARIKAEARLEQHTRDVTEGRILVKPPTPPNELRDQHLTAVAKQLNFVKEDGTPDLDAAAKVDGYVTSTVRSALQPIEQTTLRGQADANMAGLWAKATKDGIPEEALEVVAAEFKAVMGQPNAAALIADPHVAQTIFEKGLGAAYTAGKLTGKAAAPKPPAPPVVPGEPTGRRPAAGAVTLSPALQKVYKDAGLDPNKSFTATKAPQPDSMGAYNLED